MVISMYNAESQNKEKYCGLLVVGQVPLLCLGACIMALRVNFKLDHKNI